MKNKVIYTWNKQTKKVAIFAIAPAEKANGIFSYLVYVNPNDCQFCDTVSTFLSDSEENRVAWEAFQSQMR